MTTIKAGSRNKETRLVPYTLSASLFLAGMAKERSLHAICQQYHQESNIGIQFGHHTILALMNTRYKMVSAKGSSAAVDYGSQSIHSRLAARLFRGLNVETWQQM
jgi:hypothetical protein